MAAKTQRSDWAEEFAAELCSRPLVRETVFLRPKYRKGTEREVCDLILVLRKKAIPVQMKCQENPRTRSRQKLERWVLKQVRKASSQLVGAVRTLGERDSWAQHDRRGVVHFAKGELEPVHGIVLAEHFDERILLPANFPLMHNTLPIAYFTVNDFLNIVVELRSFPEMLSYLEWRRRFPAEIQRAVGSEKALFECYLLNQESPPNLATHDELEEFVRTRYKEIQNSIAIKHAADADAHLIEFVADALATRLGSYAEGLSADLVEKYDDSTERKNYLLMQENLCDLVLADRRLFGKQFRQVIEAVEGSTEPSPMRYAAGFTDAKPGFLYVFAASRGIPRAKLVKRAQTLIRGGCAFYGKRAGMVIIDRDGEGFELTQADGFVPSDRDKAVGNQLFRSLRVSDIPRSFIPHGTD